VKHIIDKIEHLLCVASDAGKAEASGDAATAERLDMELKRGVEAIEQALSPKVADTVPARWPRNPDAPCGHMLNGVRKDYCPRCQRAALGRDLSDGGQSNG